MYDLCGGWFHATMCIEVWGHLCMFSLSTFTWVLGTRLRWSIYVASYPRKHLGGPDFFFISLHSRLASNSRSPLASASEYRNYKHEPPRPHGSIQFSGIGFVHIVKPQLLFFPEPFTVSDRNSEPAELILFPRLCEFDLRIVLGYLL
jgi:hypothetical protein